MKNTPATTVRLKDHHVLTIEGHDAARFIENQFTNSIKDLPEHFAQYSGWCNAQGRLLASFPLWSSAQKYWLIVPKNISSGFVKRLRLFVLRDKVKISICDEISAYIFLGEETLSATHTAPAQSFAQLPYLGTLIISQEQPPALPPEENQDAFEAKCIQQGIAFVDQGIEGQIVPQMINYDLLPAVHFKKGCYPGQEVIARTKYLGKIKRRMYLVKTQAPLVRGKTVHQKLGLVVSCSIANGNTYDSLAVLHTEEYRQLTEAGIEAQSLKYPTSGQD